jgi:DNA-binding transcriptional ArsR family regulator
MFCEWRTALNSKPTEPAAERLHAIMAGSGNPYGVLTPLRKRLLRALHDGAALDDLPEAFGLSQDEVRKELAPLADASLLHLDGSDCYPTFFIADAAETDRVFGHAETVGKELGETLLRQWGDFEALRNRLEIGDAWGFRALSFLLVGDLILDIGLLDALARDRTLMPGAPRRPSPEDPKARFYFWMIDGDWSRLGRYGQRSRPLPWANWYVTTYGEYWINGAPNEHRGRFEAEALALVEDGRAETPDRLAELVAVPRIGEGDFRLWTRETRATLDGLVAVYRGNEASIRGLYSDLRASAYAPHGFAEFFCWYDHVAYAGAIDFLVEARVMTIPENRYVAAIRYDDGKGAFGL